MPRVTKSVTAKSKHKKILSSTRGQYGARSRLYKTAKHHIKSSNTHSEIGNRKRNIRALWIARINAGSRELSVILKVDELDVSKEYLLNRKHFLIYRFQIVKLFKRL